MDRFLALSPEDRRQAFEQAGIRRGLPAGSVEKDFWVCLMLREIFGLPEIGDALTFKGGTSLSKAWGLIDRFSEDIDLTIGRDAFGFGEGQGPEAARSGAERKRRLGEIKSACRALIAQRIQPALDERLRAVFPLGENWKLTLDTGDPDSQTLSFAYPSRGGEASLAYLKPVVKLEFGARADPWPAAVRAVRPIVAEEFEALFDAPAVAVRALLPERTFWEKILLLHEENLRPGGGVRRAGLARHYYDVWRLLERGVGDTARVDPALFDQVVAHRQLFFRHTWMNYETMRLGSIQVLPRLEDLEAWRRDYEEMHREMFADTPPPFETILESLAAYLADLNAR